jgi:hypothetical protein
VFKAFVRAEFFKLLITELPFYSTDLLSEFPLLSKTIEIDFDSNKFSMFIECGYAD